MQKITSNFLADEELNSLRAKRLYSDKYVDVFLIKRSGISHYLSPSHDKLCWKFLNELRVDMPSIFLWANVDHIAGSLIGSAEYTSDQRSIWRLQSDIKFETLLGNESDLGWALFYFAEKNGDAPQVPDMLPTDSVELALLAIKMKVDVMIVSWYDDTEWLVIRKR